MPTREEARKLYRRYRSNRAGIRSNSEMAMVCLICESIHVVPVANSSPPVMKCQNCGFEFIRYQCHQCGSTVDGRDPANPSCHGCGWRICTCTACTPGACPAREQRQRDAAPPPVCLPIPEPDTAHGELPPEHDHLNSLTGK